MIRFVSSSLSHCSSAEVEVICPGFVVKELLLCRVMPLRLLSPFLRIIPPMQRRKLKWPERLIITAQRVPTFLGIVPRKCEFTLKLPSADAAVQRLFDGEVMPRWTLVVDPSISGGDSV